MPEVGSERKALHAGPRVAAALVAPHAAIGIGTAAALALVYRSDRANMLAECIIHKATGIYCPACGGLRAMHDLMHGNVVDALRDNVLVTVGVPLVLMLWLLALFGKGRSAEPSAKAGAFQAWLAVLGILTVFTVARNLAVFAFLAPA